MFTPHLVGLDGEEGTERVLTIEGPYRIPGLGITVDGERWLRVGDNPKRPDEPWWYQRMPVTGG